MASAPTGPINTRPPNHAPPPNQTSVTTDVASPSFPPRVEHHQLTSATDHSVPMHAPLIKLDASLDSHPACKGTEARASSQANGLRALRRRDAATKREADWKFED